MFTFCELQTTIKEICGENMQYPTDSDSDSDTEPEKKNPRVNSVEVNAAKKK